MQTEKVVIIIPTYNEAAVIEKTILSVFEITDRIDAKDIHILIFDSNSTDSTQQIIRSLQKDFQRLHLVTESKKSGLGSAYHQAMHHALSALSADIIVEFDADLSHQPHYLPLMLDTLNSNDVVIGSRYIHGGSIPNDWGWHRKLFSIVGNLIARLVLTTQYKDFTSGFRMTRASMLKKVLPEKFISNHYAYKIELLWLLHQCKAKIVEYPIHFIDRKYGQCKLPSNSVIDSLYVLWMIRLKRYIRYLKMCLVGFSGMIIQYTLYNILRNYMSPFHAIQIGITIAIINGFLLNSFYTFKGKDKPLRTEQIRSFIMFVGYAALMMNYQAYWLDMGIRIFGSGLLKENLIMFAGTVTSSVLNYFIYAKIIWRKHNIHHTAATTPSP